MIFEIASSTDIINLSFLSLGTILTFTIGTIVGGFVALLGLGFAIEKLSRYIFGTGVDWNYYLADKKAIERELRRRHGRNWKESDYALEDYDRMIDGKDRDY